MRHQGKKGNNTGLQMARVVQDQVLCNELKLDPEDYYIADGLVLNDGDMVLVYQISDDRYIIICKVVNT
nr:hypothetical protein [uncultured Anaerostipes sp.]